MSKRVVSTLCAGLIFLGLSVSVCLGVEDFLQHLTDNRDLTDVSDNKQNLRLMHVIEQMAAEEWNEDDSGTRRKRIVQEPATKGLQIRKRETGEDSVVDYGKRNPAFEMELNNRPGFRSWRGKRSTHLLSDGKALVPAAEGIQRSKFNSWGGKRSLMNESEEFERWNKEKRDRGKRSTHLLSDGKALVPAAEGIQRSKFNSWGGKRSLMNESEEFERWNKGKRDRGKRSTHLLWDGKTLVPEAEGIQRSKFNSWGGKRSLMNELEEYDRWNKEKRDTFRSWGGKRVALVPPTLRTVSDSPGKFSNWGGKRFDMEEYTSGKRDLEYAMPYEQEGENDAEGKRGQFKSWGGKRTDERPGSVNWILRQYVNSILENDRRIGKKNVFGMKPMEENGDLTQFGFSAWRGRR